MQSSQVNPIFACVIAISMLGFSAISSAADEATTAREKAKRMHDRLTGIPPSEGVLALMAEDIEAATDEKKLAAAYRAMENQAFYNVTLKNMATPWTNEEQTVFAPLNDYTATFIGIVRDDLDFRTLLYGDILYRGNAAGLPAYSNTSNAHYEQLEDEGYDLSQSDVLVASTQSEVTGLPPEATAGIMTSRAASLAFFKDGTNRAMFRFTLLNHLCDDLEQLKDTSRTPDRIRQDVTRSPGGDSSIFLNNCLGCHAGMDPLTQAYAYYNWNYDVETDPDGLNGSLQYNTDGTIDTSTGTRVQGKYHINANNFKYGYITENDNWDNYWRQGQNSLLGWDPDLSGSGAGAKSMGQELAHSEAFAQCQVKKVFSNVCLRQPVNEADQSQLGVMLTNFINSNYQLKRVFADAAVYCMGE
jgi:hypothetical protein